MNILGIIPARYQSSRLPGKPLVDIGGRPMIEHVYQRAKQVINDVVVATDDKRIQEAVEGFGGDVVITSKEHFNGTTRCLEATKTTHNKENKVYTHIINIQGDEPLLAAEQLQELINCFDTSVELATLVQKVTRYEDLLNTSECFVTIDHRDNAIYFSRSVIPHIKGTPKEKWLEKHTFYKHIGLYGYTYGTLCDFCAMKPSSLEIAESLEQNRWIEAGRKIRVGYTNLDSIPVDTPADLERVRQLIKFKKI